MLVGLERRVCFTLTDMAARAPAYDYWRTLFKEVEADPAVAAVAAAAPGTGSANHCHRSQLRQQVKQQQQQGEKQQGEKQAAPLLPLVGWRLDVADVPQALHHYQRAGELELWELALSEG